MARMRELAAHADPPTGASAGLWGRLAAHCIAAGHAHPAIVLLALAALLAAALLAIGHGLRVDADTASLMSDELPWRQNERALERAFPELGDTIVAVVDGSPFATEQTVERLLNTLRAGSAPLAAVYAPGHGEFFARNGWLYLDLAGLERLATALNTAQPLIGRLAAQPDLPTLTDSLRLYVEHANEDQRALLQPLLDAISATVEATLDGAAAPLDWSLLFAPGGERAQRRFLILTPQPGAGASALAAVRAAIEALPAGSARTRLTGKLPMHADELDAAAAGAWLSAAASLAFVCGLLFLGLRHWGLVAAALLNLIAGLVLTAGFAALAVGRLNLISLAFGALFIGLAIDYAVHLLLRYRELLGEGRSAAAALAGAGSDIGSALLLSALTTAAAFFAFVPTDFRGVAELGLISGAGIMIALLTSLLVLPALVRLLHAAPTAPAPAVSATLRAIAESPIRHRRAVIALALAGGLLAAGFALSLRFSYNPMHLKPVDTESQRVYQELVEGVDSPLRAQLLVADAAAARRSVERLQALPQVERALWLGSFVPARQDDKLAIIGDLAVSLGAALPERIEPAPADAAASRSAIADLRAVLAERGADDSTEARLARSLARWLAAPEASAAALQSALLGGFPWLVSRLRDALAAAPVSLAELPDDLVARWRSAQGSYRIEATPRENLDEDAALIDFADAVAAVEPAAAGAPLAFVGGARTVIRAFVEAFALAAVVIVVLLAILLRAPLDILRALLPLALGTLLTAGAAAALGLQLNFANIIALPLLLGIGLDNGIHVIWRARKHGGNPLLGSTGRAISFSVLTTLFSFASLMLSPHRGMASMGALLSLGLALALLCSLVVLPALLPRPSRNRQADQRQSAS